MSSRKALRMLPKYDPDNNIGAVDRVRFAMIHNRMDALNADELEQFNRWKQIDDIIRSKRYAHPTSGKIEPAIGRRQIRNGVMVKFLVSWDTAERDIKNAMNLFSVTEDEKDYYRSAYVEDLELKAEEAAAAGEYPAYAKIMQLIIELRELNKPVIYTPMDKFQAFQFIIEYNPEAIGLKTIPNKDAVFAKWQKKKSASDKMLEDADDARIV